MPDLPAISLSEAHFSRVVAAFPGDTAAEKAAAYRAWVLGYLIDFVRAAEVSAHDRAAEAQREAAVAAIAASLPPRPTFPPERAAAAEASPPGRPSANR